MLLLFQNTVWQSDRKNWAEGIWYLLSWIKNVSRHLILLYYESLNAPKVYKLSRKSVICLSLQFL